MIRIVCDVTAQPIAEPEVSTLRITGPMASMLGRDEAHLSKPVALALCKWLGADVHRPGLEEVEGPSPIVDA